MFPTDIIKDIASPEDLIRILRAAGQTYRADAENLRGSWQDPKAGAIWEYAAKQLEVAAGLIENKWSKM